ncbi:MAG: PAS domain-containing protein [Candidatus Pacebacteria bacterium]|nr:PAS domain-containing protein [Candidatus Paceibacterota bacterium]
MVLNDTEASKVLGNRATDYTFVRASFIRHKSLIQGLGDRSNFTGDGTPCVLVSGQPGKFGDITDCNLAFCREFGYVKKDMFGRNLTTLMPEIYAKHHHDVMQHGEKAEENTDKLVYGLHKNQYIFPAWLRVVDTPNLINGSNYVGLMYADKASANSSVAFVLLDRKFNICAVSTSALTFLELSAQTVKASQIPFAELLPRLREGIDRFTEKSGAEAEYHFPLQPRTDDVLARETMHTREDLGTRVASERWMPVNCYIHEIKMKEKGTIGYCARLSQPEREKGLDTGKVVEKGHPPAFYYAYNFDRNMFMPACLCGDSAYGYLSDCIP